MTTTTTKVSAETFATMTEQEKLDLIMALQAQPTRKLAMKVSDKTGALSLYGVNSRFPITLYAQQWEQLIATAPQITAFIKAHPELTRR